MKERNIQYELLSPHKLRLLEKNCFKFPLIHIIILIRIKLEITMNLSIYQIEFTSFL